MKGSPRAATNLASGGRTYFRVAVSNCPALSVVIHYGVTVSLPSTVQIFLRTKFPLYPRSI